MPLALCMQGYINKMAVTIEIKHLCFGLTLNCNIVTNAWHNHFLYSFFPHICLYTTCINPTISFTLYNHTIRIIIGTWLQNSRALLQILPLTKSPKFSCSIEVSQIRQAGQADLKWLSLSSISMSQACDSTPAPSYLCGRSRMQNWHYSEASLCGLTWDEIRYSTWMKWGIYLSTPVLRTFRKMLLSNSGSEDWLDKYLYSDRRVHKVHISGLCTQLNTTKVL